MRRVEFVETLYQEDQAADTEHPQLVYKYTSVSNHITGNQILLVLVLVPHLSRTESYKYYDRVIQAPLLVTLTKT
jgi:hypothetical protein